MERLKAEVERLKEVLTALVLWGECVSPALVDALRAHTDHDLRANWFGPVNGPAVAAELWCVTCDCIVVEVRESPKGTRGPSPVGWKPINSAPRSGPFLAFAPDEPGNVPKGFMWVCGGWDHGFGRWRGEATYPTPTHWMPLPDAPNS